MKKVSVAAEPRSTFGSARARGTRHAGLVPAVLYGAESAPQALQLKGGEAREMVRQGQRLVDLTTPAGTRKVFVREVQYDCTGDNILHIDFHQIALDKELTLEVAIEFTGRPVGVTAEGGVFDVYVQQVAVRCLPAAIPEKLVAEVAALKLHQNLHVSELKAPAGVTIVTPGGIVLAAVHPPHVAEVAPAAAEAGPAEPEVIGRKAAEEGEGEEAAEAKPAKAAKAGEEEKEKEKGKEKK